MEAPLEHDSQEASLTVVGDLAVTCANELGAIIPIMQMSKWRLRGQVTLKSLSHSRASDSTPGSFLLGWSKHTICFNKDVDSDLKNSQPRNHPVSSPCTQPHDHFLPNEQHLWFGPICT